jgi:hypothetical protein
VTTAAKYWKQTVLRLKMSKCSGVIVMIRFPSVRLVNIASPNGVCPDILYIFQLCA